LVSKGENFSASEKISLTGLSLRKGRVGFRIDVGVARSRFEI